MTLLCRGIFYLQFLEGFIFWNIEFSESLFMYLLRWWFYPLIRLYVLTSPCIPRVNPTWAWCVILLICCWIWVANILLRSFAQLFIRVLVYKLFFCSVFVQLWYQDNPDCIKQVWNTCSLSWNSLRKMSVNFF